MKFVTKKWVGKDVMIGALPLIGFTDTEYRQNEKKKQNIPKNHINVNTHNYKTNTLIVSLGI